MGACSQAGCLVAVRCQLLQRLIDQRFERLYGGPLPCFEAAAAKEKRWQRLFERLDLNGNGEISMAEWLQALESEENEELRRLFGYEAKGLRQMARRLFGCVHEEADSGVDLEEFRKACRTRRA